MSLPSKEVRDACSRAVHRAVSEFTDSDGAFGCAWYAFAGAIACSKATGRRYVPQIGGCDIRFQTDPEPRSVFICGEDNGFERMEYHAWIVRPGVFNPVTHIGEALEWIDFSARHYKRLLELPHARDVHTLGDGAMLVIKKTEPEPWTAPEPPEYVWHAGAEPPDGLAFYADEASCLAFIKDLVRRVDEARRLARLTHRYLRDELACLETEPIPGQTR